MDDDGNDDDDDDDESRKSYQDGTSFMTSQINLFLIDHDTSIYVVTEKKRKEKETELDRHELKKESNSWQ